MAALKENPFKTIYVADKIDIKIRKIREINNKYLDEFEQYLKETGLSKKTIENHLLNLDVYLNSYLARTENDILDWSMEEGCYALDGFLGYYFIKKCMWSSPSQTRSCIAGIKKFYKFLFGKGAISKVAYNDMLQIIKEEKNNWIRACKEYNESIGIY